MSDPAPALLLVARRAGERLEELVPLVRAVREACGLDAPPSLSLHYRTRTRTLALGVAGALPGGPKGVAREVLDGWRGSWRLQAVAPPVEAVAGLLAPFDVVIPNLLDTLGALARLQEAASAARPERRRGRRYPAGTLEARFDAGGRAHSGRVWDLSTGGCFVALEAPRPPVGEVVDLVLGDAGTDAGTDVGSGAAIAARVVFHLPESRAAAFDRAPGVGLHFVGVSATARAVLTDLIGRAAEARGAQGPGRRLETRLPIILTVSLKTDAGVVECRAENLSAGGIFVATDDPPVPGTPVELRLELPGEPLPLALPATVRHLVPPGDAAGRHPGAGLAFDTLDGDLRARLDAYLTDLHRRGGARVLVVDDTAFFRTVLTDLLTGAGYEVLQAETAEAAFQVLAEEILTLDLLVLDVGLPGMSGVDLLGRIPPPWRRDRAPGAGPLGDGDRPRGPGRDPGRRRHRLPLQGRGPGDDPGDGRWPPGRDPPAAMTAARGLRSRR